MRNLIIFFIELYQEYLSPYKGFTCAHLVAHSGVSCSQAFKTILRVEGVYNGYPLIKARFQACKKATNDLKQRNKPNSIVDHCLADMTIDKCLSNLALEGCACCACSFFS